MKKITQLILLSTMLLLCSVVLATDGRITLKGYIIDLGSMGTLMKDTPVGPGIVRPADPIEVAKAITKEHLLGEGAKKTGYAIVYGSQSEGSIVPLDKKGNEMAREVILASSKNSGIRVEVTGQRNKKGLKVKSIKEIE
jgi:hypothetical protein